MSLTWLASFKVRISSVAWNTCANASVILCFTFSIGSTCTRIYTLLISASQSCWTLWIGETLIWFAFYIWTTLVPRRTLAASPVDTNSAKCLDTTLFIWTRILALSLNASLCQWTLIITFTASYKLNFLF